jgi:ubiquinone/menaquinone biosynthesis C-methylase UbiE
MPDVYEDVLVPAIFAPWSQALVERTRPVGPADRILDLGCGTGIVARTLRSRLGAATDIVGVDASAAMLAKARQIAPDMTWHEADATKLPFDDHAFEIVVCQQMLQFVTDRGAALREIRRVLVPGGRLVGATWRARHELPLYEALGVVAERHLGTPHEKRFALGNDAELRQLLDEAGFSDVRLDVLTREEHFTSFPYRLSALAANFDVSAWTAAELERRLDAVEGESLEAVRPFAVAGGIRAPSRANVFVAIA